MIKTKLFTGYFVGQYGTSDRRFIDVDKEINEFLLNNKIELIDIKFSVAVQDGDSWNHALMIYKEV